MVALNRRQALVGGASAALLPGRPVRAQATNIRIAMITQLSGYAQAFGYANRSGAEIAVDRINRMGGIDGKPVELVLRDDRGVTDAAVSAYRELYADGVRFFVGGPISACGAAVGGLMGTSDALFIAAGSGSLAITHENYNRNVFRVQFTSVPYYTGLAYVVAKTNPGIQKWAIIGSDQQVGVDSVRIFARGVKHYYKEMSNTDVTVLEPILTKAGSGDFRTPLAQLASSGAEGIFNGLVGSDGLTFYQQARAYALDKTIKVFAENAAELQIVKAFGKNIPANIWSVTPWYYDKNSDNAVSKQLYDEYLKRNPADRFPFGYVGIGHDAVVAFAEAMRAAHSTRQDTVRTAMENGSPLGALGKLVFRKEDHALLADLTYINFGSDPAAPEGWLVRDVERIPSAGLTEPATPGEKYLVE